MNTNNINKCIKNINCVTCFISAFLFLRILLTDNINIIGAKGALVFAVITPFLCWNTYKNLQNNIINESDSISTSNTNDNYTNLKETELQLQAQEIAEKYSIAVEDAYDMLADYTYGEVCEALEECEAENTDEIKEDNISTPNTNDSSIIVSKHTQNTYNITRKSRELDI